jgi:hypothetical protein
MCDQNSNKPSGWWVGLSPPTSRPGTLDTQKGTTLLAEFQIWKINTDKSQDAKNYEQKY